MREMQEVGQTGDYKAASPGLNPRYSQAAGLSINKRPSILVRDRLSVRLAAEEGARPRLTFRRSRNNSSMNDFTQALLQMPLDNDNFVIFPWDDELKEFVIDDEAKVQSIENVTREDIDKVFEKLQQSPYHDLYGNMHYKLMAPFILILVAIIVFLLFFQDSLKFSKSSNTVVGLFFAIFGVLFLLIVLVSIFWARYLKQRLTAREADFVRILNELNSDYFCDKDVFWKCGKLGTYIQLDLNYKFKGAEDALKANNSNSVKNMISISMNMEQSNLLTSILQQTRLAGQK